MNYFIASFTGKHPIQLNDFEHLQQAYLEGFHALCKALLPDDTLSAVLTGCLLEIDELNLTFSLTEGYVYHEGEIYLVHGVEGDYQVGQIPFLSIIVNYADFNPVEYKDGNLRDVHQIRTMALSFLDAGSADEETIDFRGVGFVDELFVEKLGLSDTTLQIQGLQDRLDIAEEDIIDLQDRLELSENDILDLQDRLDIVEEDIENLQDRLDSIEPIVTILQGNPILMIDSDSIVYFGIDGRGTDIWLNWALCDGRNLTPDLRGKFIAGYDPANIEYDLEAQGGEEKVALLEEEMPPHFHTVKNGMDLNQGNDFDGTSGNAWYAAEVDTQLAGGILDAGTGITEVVPHENRPPYYVLAFAKKIA